MSCSIIDIMKNIILENSETRGRHSISDFYIGSCFSRNLTFFSQETAYCQRNWYYIIIVTNIISIIL